jgi:2,3-bisphosphoglycerate-dependent phosphoglycerate mutase
VRHVTGTLVLLRHGQSTWNSANLFTGWHDVPLTELGESEARAAGRTMAEAGLRFHTSHTSLLTRAVDKKATTERHGAEQTHRWRRSYDVPPPPVELDHPEHPASDPRYAGLPRDVLPASECLRDVVVRVLPYWYDSIAPQLLAGLDVLVTAHGNSLRALLKHLEDVSDADIADINIPTGVPRRYTFDAHLAVTSAEYLGDAAAIAAAADAVARQAGT